MGPRGGVVNRLTAHAETAVAPDLFLARDADGELDPRGGGGHDLEDKYFLFPVTPRIPAPTDESPNLTTLVIYFRPLGDVNDTEKCENRARKTYSDETPSRAG
jgi:hypothetical protein